MNDDPTLYPATLIYTDAGHLPGDPPLPDRDVFNHLLRGLLAGRSSEAWGA